MSLRWFCIAPDGTTKGPIEEPMLLGMLKDGFLPPSTRVRCEGQQEWQAANEVEALGGAKPSVPMGGPNQPAVRWFYQDARGKRQGPISQSGLAALFSQGAYTSQTPVWSDLTKEWVPAINRKEFANVLSNKSNSLLPPIFDSQRAYINNNNISKNIINRNKYINLSKKDRLALMIIASFLAVPVIGMAILIGPDFLRMKFGINFLSTPTENSQPSVEDENNIRVKIAWKEINSKLKTPSTSSYSKWLSWNVNGYDAYCYYFEFDAQNDYGALVRSEGVALVYKAKSNGQWQCGPFVLILGPLGSFNGAEEYLNHMSPEQAANVCINWHLSNYKDYMVTK